MNKLAFYQGYMEKISGPTANYYLGDWDTSDMISNPRVPEELIQKALLEDAERGLAYEDRDYKKQLAREQRGEKETGVEMAGRAALPALGYGAVGGTAGTLAGLGIGALTKKVGGPAIGALVGGPAGTLLGAGIGAGKELIKGRQPIKADAAAIEDLKAVIKGLKNKKSPEYREWITDPMSVERSPRRVIHRLEDY